MTGGKCELNRILLSAVVRQPRSIHQIDHPSKCYLFNTYESLRSNTYLVVQLEAFIMSVKDKSVEIKQCINGRKGQNYMDIQACKAFNLAARQAAKA